MEELESAIQYLKDQLQRPDNKPYFRICCRWSGAYMIDVAGNVYKRGDGVNIRVPNVDLGIEEYHIQEWVNAAKHILALHRLDGKPLPPEIADALRQAGV